MNKKICLAFTVLALSLNAMSGSDDPFSGRWRLDSNRSKYPDNTCPQSMIIEMAPSGNGVRYRSDTTYRNGAQSHAAYTADYNGKQVLVTGTRGMFLPVLLRRIDSHTVIASYISGFQIAATSRRVVSLDGKLMTITTTSQNAAGKKVTSTAVFMKE